MAKQCRSRASSWTTHVPLLVLSGEADTWTPFAPCEAFITAAKARGNPIEFKNYPSAGHAFDAPNLARTELPAYRSGDGPIPVMETIGKPGPMLFRACWNS